MQPYIFPYLGYFQLVNHVDSFVFFDDVNFIKKGWIHRNQLLQGENPIKFTVPLHKASQNKRINEIHLSDYSGWKIDFIKKVEHCYKKAPNYNSVYSLILSILDKKEYLTIAELAIQSVTDITSFMGISTSFVSSNGLDYDKGADNGQQKIISICKTLGATSYTNPYNGRDMYDVESFEKASLELSFLQMQEIKYEQFKKATFTPSLSVIDVLMFNSREDIQLLLSDYQLK